MSVGLIVGIVFLLILIGSTYFLAVHKPGQIRRRDRVIEDE